MQHLCRIMRAASTLECIGMSMRTRFSPQSLLLSRRLSLSLRTRGSPWAIGSFPSNFSQRRHHSHRFLCNVYRINFGSLELPSLGADYRVGSSPKRQNQRQRRLHTMADVSMSIGNPLLGMGTSRKMSCGFNGKTNGIEGKTPFLIGVSGGTASGKSTVCKRIMEKLGQVDMDHTERQVVCISQDSFYRDLTEAEKMKAEKGQYNFDHPDAFDNDLILQTLQDILAGVKCEIPAYDYRTNSLVKDQITTIYPADVVLFEGILVFYFPKIRDLFHMKLFVDTDSDTRLARRVPRDIKERGRDLDYVLNQYMNFVKPAFEEFCLPTKKFADVIIPRGADNTVAIELIVQHIRDLLSNRGRNTTTQVECAISRAEGVFKRPH